MAIGIGGKIADEAENWGPVTMAARLRLFEIDAGVVWLDREGQWHVRCPWESNFLDTLASTCYYIAF